MNICSPMTLNGFGEIGFLPDVKNLNQEPWCKWVAAPAEDRESKKKAS